MMRLILCCLWIILGYYGFSQKKWDGGGNNSQWSDHQNWLPDGAPGPTDDVILDNTLVPGSYQVELPSGSVTTEIRSLNIEASGGIITVIIPVINIATTALIVNGSGSAITIGRNGILRNASGAGSGNPILLTGSLTILDGGHYIHQTPRGNAALIDKLSTVPGTETGAFVFDVPGLAGYTVSLTGNTFGTLRFRAEAAGGIKSYSGSGTGNLNIRGELIIDSGAQLSSTLTADILLSGNLQVGGRLNLIPVTAGSTGRSLKFLGKNANLSGSGLLTMNANFRVLEITNGSKLTLQKDLPLGNPSNALINYGTLDAGTYIVYGTGKFAQADLATLVAGAPAGLQAIGDSGNIQTAIREFSKRSAYIFQGTAGRETGTGLPDTVSALGINKEGSLHLTQQLYCTDSLLLFNGRLITDTLRRLVFGGRIINSPANEYGQQHAGWKDSFIDGPMTMDASDTGHFIFPVGSDTVFAPVQVRKTSTTRSMIETAYHPQIHPDSLCSPALEFISRTEYWTIKCDGQGFKGGLISFSLRPQSIPLSNGFGLKPAIYASRETINKWDTVAGKAELNNGFGWMIMNSPDSGFNDFTVGFTLPEQPLPWRLLDFKASYSDKTVQLRWQADEDNEKMEYTVEKSSDGIHFSGFRTLFSTGMHYAAYEVSDNRPFPGETYYRLSISAGSRKEYSMTRKVTIKEHGVRLFPNPTADYIHIYFPGLSSSYELSIVNIQGLIVYKSFFNAVTCQIRVSNLRNGMYVVKLRHNNELITLPFTKY